MPGRASLAFLREPSFFLAEEKGNLESQVVVARDVETNTIVGTGCRSIRRMYVNGRETTAGYLSMLRGVPEVRGGTGLARGYGFLRGLHADGKAAFYVTTILDDNIAAASLLKSGRAGLPTYEPAGSFRTFLIPIKRRRRTHAAAAIVTPETLPRARRCLDDWNCRHQFAPVDCEPLPLYVIERRKEIVATLAVWDQQSFKQTVVTSYARGLRMGRPFYNVASRVCGHPTLPNVGQPIRLVYGACISADDVDDFETLLDYACAGWSGRGHDYLCLGFGRSHPLAAIATARATQTIDSTLYVVYWNANERPALDGRLPHLEIATL